MGDYLVVGIHNDEEISKHKGIPVMTMQERIVVLEACRWVDEVIANVPYVTDLNIVKQHGCSFCVHGDDVILGEDGRDLYAEAKAVGMYREYARTKAISTTELVGRMLLATTQHLDSGISNPTSPRTASTFSEAASAAVRKDEFLPTCTRISQFSPHREPKPTDRVVYVDGDFDLFHAGHVMLLRAARAMGDFLVVGVHTDSEVHRIKGGNFPLMNMMERVLTVLACRYVDEVVIGAPYSISREMMNGAFNFHLVVHGKTPVLADCHGKDPYEVPKAMGKYVEVEHEFGYLGTCFLVDRIVARRKEYEERNRRKLMQ